VPTNVTRITRALKSYTKKDGISQIVYYQSGVGTGGTLNKILGGEFIDLYAPWHLLVFALQYITSCDFIQLANHPA
jgi:hypothetical protein